MILGKLKWIKISENCAALLLNRSALEAAAAEFPSTTSIEQFIQREE